MPSFSHLLTPVPHLPHTHLVRSRCDVHGLVAGVRVGVVEAVLQDLEQVRLSGLPGHEGGKEAVE